MEKAKTLLFVCTGNTCRSSMAEIIAKSLLAKKDDRGDGITVISAGTSTLAGEPASCYAVQTMSELGLDLSGHRAVQLTTELVRDADLILCMTGSHKNFILSQVPDVENKVFLLKEYACLPANTREAVSLDITDPFGRSLDYYRVCANELHKYIEPALAKFLVSMSNNK